MNKLEDVFSQYDKYETKYNLWVGIKNAIPYSTFIFIILSIITIAIFIYYMKKGNSDYKEIIILGTLAFISALLLIHSITTHYYVNKYENDMSKTYDKIQHTLYGNQPTQKGHVVAVNKESIKIDDGWYRVSKASIVKNKDLATLVNKDITYKDANEDLDLGHYIKITSIKEK